MSTELKPCWHMHECVDCVNLAVTNRMVFTHWICECPADHCAHVNVMPCPTHRKSVDCNV